MPKDTDKQINYLYTQNREISWLRFNKRVLEEAKDHGVPAMERLKFIAIFSDNLGEFFMVRVGRLFDLDKISPEKRDDKTGMTPGEQLERIYGAVPEFIKLKRRLYTELCGDLEQLGVADVSFEKLRDDERKRVKQYFKMCVKPIISPIIISPHHPFPHLANRRIYIAAHLADKKGRRCIGIVPIPESLPPYYKLSDAGVRFIRTEEIILAFASSLFGSYGVVSRCILSVTRNADLSFDSEEFEDGGEDFRETVSRLLKKRGRQGAVRLELDRRIPGDFLSALGAFIPVERRQIYVDSCPLNMKYVYRLVSELTPEQRREMLYPPFHPQKPEDIDEGCGMIEQISEKDRLLFFPYDSVVPFLRLLSEAAENPDVLSIKITVYRLASYSKIAHILCRAAENGKEVLVLMELRARFDEANNITWSKLLEEAGCQVIYGIEDFKCHSKICLITLRDKGGVKYITQIGTGNYNERTCAMYTDLSLMTADEDIGRDGTAFFQNMLVNNTRGSYSQLLVSPEGIKSALIRLIEEEAAKGKDGYICLKVNSLTEREVIDSLMRASRAGAEVQLIVRSICCILPSIPGFTENIYVTGIVGRFLEHARIYRFGRGEASQLYISSADIMNRNLCRRVEIACPVTDSEIKRQLCLLLDTQLRDSAKGSYMTADGEWRRKSSDGTGLDSQLEFTKKSLHTPGSAEHSRASLIRRTSASALKRLKRKKKRKSPDFG